MKTKYHLILVLVVFTAWLFFYVIGLPSDYFIKYNQAEKLLLTLAGLFAAVPFLSFITISLLNIKAFKSALWMAFYASMLPFILDFFVLGIHRNCGFCFLKTHWYLTLGYIAVWLIIPLVGLAIEKIKTKET